MDSPKWCKTSSFLLLCGIFVIFPVLIHSQDASEGTRKILSRRPPQYPEIARRMKISGNVKLEAIVAPNGSVKSVEVKGGHPLLAQTAQDAIREWKWEPTSHETHEIIEVKFDNSH